MMLAIDLEADLIAHLSEAFPGYRIATEVPDRHTGDLLISVVVIGSPRLNELVDQAQANFVLFHPNPERVMDEALRLQAVLGTLRTAVIRETSPSYPSRTGTGADDESPRRFLYTTFRLRKGNTP